MSQMPPGTPGPGAPSPGSANPKAAEIKSKAMTSLILGIISLVCCGIILGPIAIITGNGAKKMIQQSNCGQEHQQLANIGVILGWIGLVITVIILIAQVAMFALSASQM